MHDSRPFSVPPSPVSIDRSELIRSFSVPPQSESIILPQVVLSATFVNKAFEEYDKGIQERILHIVTVLENYYSHEGLVISIDTLNIYSSFIEMLNQTYISKLSSKHSLLVRALLHTNWSRFESSDESKSIYDSAYSIFLIRMSDLILNVLSAFPFHLIPALEALVGGLSTVAISMGSNSVKSKKRGQNLSNRIHNVLKPLTKMIPSLQSSILPLVNDFFPHPRQVDSFDHLSFYLSECLKICIYWPEIRPALLELLVSKIVQIDVEVQIEVDELEDDVIEHLENDILDDVDEEGDVDEALNDDYIDRTGHVQEIDEDSCPILSNSFDSVTTIKFLINRLDNSLQQLFSFIVQIKEEESELSFANLFLSFLITFEKIILPTMRSRYTQFLLFFITSLDDKYPDYFLGVLVSRVSSTSTTSASSILAASMKGSGLYYNSDSSSTWIDTLKLSSGCLTKSLQSSFGSGTFDALKLTAASYIGGYVARAKFIPTKTVRKCISYLLSWVNKYIRTNGCPDCQQGLICTETSGNTCKAQFAYKHSVFFSVSQALFYILCFRHEECLSISDNSEDSSCSEYIISQLSQLLFNECLNPLASIQPSISGEFVKIIESNYPSLCKANNGHEMKSILTPANSRSTSPVYSHAPSINSTTSTSFLAEDSLTISAHLKALESLENFFPFDPYRLPVSRSHIPETLFINWPGSSVDNDDTKFNI